MACIEHYIKDAENIFEDIEFREKYVNSFTQSLML